jgi:hypothetical protein
VRCRGETEGGVKGFQHWRTTEVMYVVNGGKVNDYIENGETMEAWTGA